MWTPLIPHDINELCAMLHSHVSDEHLFMFRGQSDHKWSLRPTILRDFGAYCAGESEQTRLMREYYSIELFRKKAGLHLHKFEIDMLGRVSTTLILMQHYGGSTRLLDWSLSAWVAAYFAAIEHPDKDGAIWAVNSKALSQVSPASNLQSQKYRSLHGKFASLLDIPHAALWYKISLDLPDNKVCLVSPTVDNPRMNAQQSLFTMAGRIGVAHDIIGDMLSNTEAFKIIIPGHLKLELLKRLDKMNILATNLFPDIIGIARRTRESVRHNFVPTVRDFMTYLEAEIEDLRLPNRAE